MLIESRQRFEMDARPAASRPLTAQLPSAQLHRPGPWPQSPHSAERQYARPETANPDPFFGHRPRRQTFESIVGDRASLLSERLKGVMRQQPYDATTQQYASYSYPQAAEQAGQAIDGRQPQASQAGNAQHHSGGESGQEGEGRHPSYTIFLL